MNKFKKLVVVAMSLVMALALAVPAFADDIDAYKAKMNKYLADRGINQSVVNALTADQVNYIKNNEAKVKGILETTISDVKADPDNATNYVSNAGANAGVPGVSLQSCQVQVTGNKFEVAASVKVNDAVVPAFGNGDVAPKPTPKPEKDEPNDDPPVPVVPTTPAVEENKVAATYSAPVAVVNPLTVTSASVIKATGDNSAVVVVAAVLSVVAVLGLGFRKNSSMTVA